MIEGITAREDLLKAFEKNQGTEKSGENADLRNVAKEMESLFAYELLKTMRETSKSMSAEDNKNGYDTYMSLFDMELSKLFGERGIGLQEAIMRSLERMNDGNESGGADTAEHAREND